MYQQPQLPQALGRLHEAWRRPAPSTHVWSYAPPCCLPPRLTRTLRPHAALPAPFTTCPPASCRLAPRTQVLQLLARSGPPCVVDVRNCTLEPQWLTKFKSHPRVGKQGLLQYEPTPEF